MNREAIERAIRDLAPRVPALAAMAAQYELREQRRAADIARLSDDERGFYDRARVHGYDHESAIWLIRLAGSMPTARREG
jgi:hypothetical protein